MRIVDVSAFYSPQGGGVRAYVDRKLAAAHALGCEIIVIAPGKDNTIVRRGPGAVIETIASPVLALDRRYRYFNDERALHAALDRWAPDFVEASSPWASAAMVARWDGPAPRSLVMHADPMAAYPYRWFGGVASIATIDRGFDFFWEYLRKLSREFDMVVTASRDLGDRLRNAGMAGITTLPMGVEPGLFSPAHRDAALRADILRQLALPPEAHLLLGVGRYAPEKRWGMVIDAALAANTRVPLALMLVGEGRSRRQLIRRTGGSPHVMIGAPLGSRRALATLMASADALVHGCEAETYCMVAAEARASGIPIIAPDRGGATDHADGERSRLYTAASTQALRDAMLDVAGSRALKPVPIKPVRTMDHHFQELFARYCNVARPLPLAA